MARGIPDVPLDGETYASVGVAGLPMVLEYDGPTGGYKMVVSTEAGVAINISGTVEITGGQLTVVGAAQYGEDTPHTSGQTGTFIMGVRQDALASSVGADGDYAGLQVDSLGRLRVLSYGSNFLAPLNSSQYAEDSGFVGGSTGTMVLAVRTDRMQTWVSDDGDLATLNVDALGRLYTFQTGSYVFADTELSAAVALGDVLANPTAGGVGAFLLGYDDNLGSWARARLIGAAELDNIDNDYFGNSLATQSVIRGVNATGDYDRIRGNIERGLYVSLISGSFPGQDGSTFLSDVVANPYAGLIGSLGMGYDPVATTWRRVRLDAVTGAQIVSVTGTVTVDTELPAAAVAADGYANPTAPSVLSHLMAYNGATWDRLYMGISGSLAVDLVSQLDAVNDEVTAYITGSTSLNLMGKTITRAVIDFSGSVASETALVAAIGGQQIKVLEVMLIGNTDVTIFFQSGFTGTALTGPMSLPADGDGFFVETPAQIEAHHFETLSGEALVLDVDANVLLGGWLNYYAE